MGKFVIHGGNRLKGAVTVRGAKNEALPVLAATLLTADPCLIRNVPKISDVTHLLEVLKSLGAEVSWEGERDVRVCAAKVKAGNLDAAIVGKLRGSVLLMGPLLARFGRVELPEPGGDIIGKRPLDTHFLAFEEMGAEVEQSDGLVRISGRLHAAPIILSEMSVTATENALMAAAATKGETVVKLAAAEPHVQGLCRFLAAMGAEIDGIGTHTLTVRGARDLRGAEHIISPDPLEVGAFIAAFAATGGEGTIRNFIREDMDAVMKFSELMGIPLEYGENELRVGRVKRLNPFNLKSLPYPGFPSDLVSPFAVLATQAEGMSMIHEPLYEGRLGYIYWLVKMGANAVVCDPHRVVISGPTPMHGYEIKAPDIRAGATLVIAGLAAKGETVVHDAEILDRGYEDLAGRLAALGADIRRA